MMSIPDLEEPGRYFETDFINSRFIKIETDDLFEVSMQYPALGMKYAEKDCFVREEVYEKLCRASKELPRGYKIKILDTWRPFLLQKELYETYSKDIIKEFELNLCTEDQRKAVIRKFVSEPIEDIDVPPVHTTGGAVDVTIVDKEGQELDMGTKFDAFSDKTYTAFFENEKKELVRENRRLLYNTMVGQGFTNLPSEWWHYDYGDRFWGFYKKKKAIYKGFFTKEELNGTKQS